MHLEIEVAAVVVYGVGLLLYVYTKTLRALSAVQRLLGMLKWVFVDVSLASAGSPRAKAGR